MISLDQIKSLESKINKAVELIKMLREENRALNGTIDSSQKKMQELEKLVDNFKADQSEIEQGILRALKNLDHLEDEITDGEEKKQNKTETPAALKNSSSEKELEIF